MRVVFFGTPAFAVPTLDALLASGADIAAVVTQPDRPRTRSHSTLLPPPVKLRALEAGIPVLQPERPRGEEFLAAIRALDADIGVVVAYGHLLRPELLAIPRNGMVNVHASLLPRWRGAAPIHWALLSGDATTGVSIMRMEAGLDSGPVWHKVETPIGPHETTGMLFERLAPIGAQALVATLPRIGAGEIPAPQDESHVTLAPKIDRAMARIDWDAPADKVAFHIRAMDPFPGAWTTWQDSTIKMFDPATEPWGEEGPAPSGTILTPDPSLRVACAGGVLRVGYVQVAGKNRITSEDWLNGHPTAIGTTFK